MESMIEFLEENLKNADLDTITKADLRKKFMKENGLCSLTKEEKKSFSITVVQVLKKYAAINKADDSSEADNELREIFNRKNNSDVKVKSNGQHEGKRKLSLSSEDEDFYEAQRGKRKKQAMVLSDDESKGADMVTSSQFSVSSDAKKQKGNIKGKKRKLSSETAERKTKKIHVISSDSEEAASVKISNVKHSIDSEDESLGSLAFSESEEHNINASKISVNSKIKLDEKVAATELKPFKHCDSKDVSLSKSIEDPNSSEDELLSNLKRKDSSDSEDEPLINAKKNDSSDSEDEPLINAKKNDSSDSEDESLANNREKNSSDSEDEPLTNKREKNSSDSEDEPLTNLKKNDSSDSEDEPLTKLKKNYSSDSEDEPLTNLKKNDSSDSEDEPLTNLKKNDSSDSEDRPLTNLKKDDSSDSEDEPLTKLKKNDSSDSEDEPLTNLKKNDSSDSEDRPLIKTKGKYSSDSEGESLQKLAEIDSIKSKKNLSKLVKKDFSDSEEDPLIELKNNHSSDSESEQFNKVTKKDCSDSEEEPLTKVASKNRTKEKLALLSDSENEKKTSRRSSTSSKTKISKERNVKKEASKSSTMQRSDGESSDEEKVPEESISKEKNESNKKKINPAEKKLESLKKYIRAAGIRIQSYIKLFESCKTMKSKHQKLIDLLEEHGMKGRPTLAKCKKLKEKIETAREVAELDTTKIIPSKGRPKRNACADVSNRKDTADNVNTPLKVFSRLVGIVDSD